VTTTVVKTPRRYWGLNPKQLSENMLHWEESELADIYHSSTPARNFILKYVDKILIYVDDILCVHHDPGSLMAKLDEYFKMNEGSIQVLTFYLGAKLKKTVLPNGSVAWGMSSSKYVQSAVQNVKQYLAALPGEQKLTKKASGPFAGGYKPELDESPELDTIRANFYKSQIGILRWCVELGRIGIMTEVSMLSNYLFQSC
jgi:hypothetical protein